MTALWFWDIGGMRVEPLTFPIGRIISKVTCYTCGAIFAWRNYVEPLCPVCKSRGTCDSEDVPFGFQVSTRYVRDDDGSSFPPAHGSQGF